MNTQMHNGSGTVPTAREYFRAFYQGNRLLYAAVMILNVSSNLLLILLSVTLGDLMDIAAGGSMKEFYKSCGMIAVFLILNFIMDTLSGRLRCLFLERAMRQYKEKVFEKLTQKSISAFSKENTGRYLSVLNNDAAIIESNYLNNSFSLVQMSFLFVITLCVLVWYNPFLTLLALALCILPLAVMLLMGGELANREQKVSRQNEHFVASLQDLLKGFSVIKSFQAEKRVQTLFSKGNHDLENARFSRGWYEKLLHASALSASLLMQCGVMLAAVWLALHGTITIGTVVIFINCCNYLMQPIQSVPQDLAGWKAARGLVKKTTQITEENVREEGCHTIDGFHDELALQKVTFGYDSEKAILQDISLRLYPGFKYALAGTSGSGKSTLLQLLMGAFNDYRGSITLDGQELKDIHSDSLYDVMSLIGQDVFIFNDTILNNITMFGDFPADQVNTAVQQAGLSTLITERGDGYLCGENGSALSGGERQRISIARALLRKTPILLVDEATAALDAETAHSVSEAILHLPGVSSITVTHRLEESLLRQYDQIFVMKDGRLAEQGDFENLMEKRGLFYSLYTVANS
ncbi:MAG: ABC transporter ATP-binding protein/permease [Lachnospiraceae bacterium]|nr:ABC transporter ATP-binding protein/permease [Lachnospiraceae bacterium]